MSPDNFGPVGTDVVSTVRFADAMTARTILQASPGGFEQYFQEIGQFFPDDATPDLEGMARANAKYGLQMDFKSLPWLIERFGLARPMEMDGETPM